MRKRIRENHTKANSDVVVVVVVELMNETICQKLLSRILEKATKKRFIFDSTEEESGRAPNRLLFDMVCEMAEDINAKDK